MDLVSRRMRAGSVLMILLMVLSLLAVGAQPAFACSCAGGGSTEEEFRQSTAVFSGEVVEVGELPPAPQGPMDPGMHPLPP